MLETPGYARLPLIQSPLGEVKNLHASVNEAPEFETHDETLFDNPQFEHYEQTSNIQLFFDLFFVANLTSFTDKHEVNSTSTLSSYIGFFCILWFTWCQVTLYDVRFSTDSVFERICHVCHFGVMLAFAVVGPQFDGVDTDWDTEQQLSLVLMVDRAILFCQYGSTLFFTWRYRKARLPLILVMISLAMAAILYLGISFAFLNMTSDNAYIAWYVVCVSEVAVNITIAGRWKVVSFKGTHLGERMTCLTLIILGEGVIGLCKSITKIEILDFNFDQKTIGTLISAPLIIYFVYQLYFDNVQLEHFRHQQIWTFLHFPFHIALVLLMEGVNQMLSWFHVVQYSNNVFAEVGNLSLNSTQSEAFQALNDAATTVFNNPALPLTQTNFTDISNLLDSLNPANTTANTTEDGIMEAIVNITIKLYQIVFEGGGFEPPETGGLESEDPTEIINAFYAVFQLAFAYFFICAGVVLISIAVFSWLSSLSIPKDKARREYIGMASNFLLGTGLALCAIMDVTPAADNLGESPWSLPVVVLVLFIALLLNHIPRAISKMSKEE